MSCFTAIVLLLSYITIKQVRGGQYSTHAYQYGWVVSLAYMDESRPAEAIAVFWLLSLLVTLGVYEFKRVYYARLSLGVVTRKQRRGRVAGESWRMWYVMVTALFLLNILVVMIINISFVYIQLTQSFTVQIFISVGLVLFKIG